MTCLLLAIAAPAISLGLLFQNGAEVTLGLIALGMAAIGAFANAMRRDWRRNHDILHGPR